jgi:threonine dehydrogenase-like Zn-dependent dehydrogenase
MRDGASYIEARGFERQVPEAGDGRHGRGGIVGVPSVYAGFLRGILFGDAFEKGLTFRMGQTHAQRFMPELLQRIERGELRPDEIITYRLPLSEAACGYEVFNDMKEDCRKVVLLPG